MRTAELARTTQRAARGFTLIELVIVLVVISILAAIAIPIFLRQRILANEGSAIAAIRTIVTSQESYRAQRVKDDDGDGVADYGTLLELSNPPVGQPFIDEVLGIGVKSGYFFNVETFDSSSPGGTAYSAYAFPQVYNRSGNRNFYADQEGVIRFTLGEAGQGTIGPDSPPIK